MSKSAPRFSFFALAQFGVCLAIGAALWLAYEPWRWGGLREQVRASAPNVPRITGQELMSWWQKSEEQPLLLDVRTDAEFQTSHLPGARLATQSRSELGIDGKFQQPIVVYCSVGFDSSQLAARLLTEGYKRVQYLDGGIFLWANEGRPLETSGASTSVVNTGSSPYARYLRRNHRQQ